MSHPLQANLVVTNAEMVGAFPKRLKVIIRIGSGYVRERQNALFGEQVIQLKLAQFDVEPAAPEKIVQARPNRFEVEGSGIVRGWQDVERNVLCQRSA